MEAFAEVGGKFKPQAGANFGQPSGASSGWGPDYGYVRHDPIPTLPPGERSMWQRFSDFVAGQPLTEEEKRYFDPLYGQQGDLSQVRVHHVPWNIGPAGAVHGLMPHQVWLMPSGESEDVLSHELAHTTQPPVSLNTFFNRSYEADPEAIKGKSFHQLGHEQQAEVLRRYYRMMTDPNRPDYSHPTLDISDLGPNEKRIYERLEALRKRQLRAQQEEQEPYQRLVEQYLRGVR